jgi:hypothetical protein
MCTCLFIEVWPFRRRTESNLRSSSVDTGAVEPGVSLSANTVLNQLERVPQDFFLDPQVRDLLTLVAGQRGRSVVASLLLRYANTQLAENRGTLPPSEESSDIRCKRIHVGFGSQVRYEHLCATLRMQP